MGSRVAIACLAFLASLFTCTSFAQSGEKTTIRISLNPVVYTYLPLFIATDKGYFASENLDVVITRYNGSSVSQMPLAARGDLDIVPMVGGPALFNQVGEGFDLKIIASMVETHKGWHDGTWIVVRKDLYDSGEVRKFADLKGRPVDGGPDGSPANFVFNQALQQAGLTRANVVYSSRLASPPDWLAGLRNKSVDALAGIEPIVTQIVAQNVGIRLLSTQDVIPWFQESFFIASEKYLKSNRSAATRFLNAYLRAAKEINEAGGKWTPEFIAIVARWSQLPEAAISQIPGPAYYGQFGAINTDSLSRQQDYFASINQVKQKIDPATIVDASIINDARRQAGMH
jgi:NitT/TauT family transport system substrate-binding protein